MKLVESAAASVEGPLRAWLGQGMTGGMRQPLIPLFAVALVVGLPAAFVEGWRASETTQAVAANDAPPAPSRAG